MGSRKIDSQVRILLTDTILALCKNTLNQYGEVAVEGLLGITLDKKEIFLVSLQEVIRNNKGGGSKRSERSKSKHSDDSEATYDSDDSTSSRSKRKRRKKHKRSRSTDNEGTPKSKADVSIKLENVEDDDLYVTKETIKRKRPTVGSSDQSSSQSGYSADAQMAQYQSGGPMRAAPSESTPVKFPTRRRGRDVIRGRTCPFCKKIFAAPSNLRDHLRIHTGERPYTCAICRRAFTQKFHMQRHLARVHNVPMPKGHSNKRNGGHVENSQLSDVMHGDLIHHAMDFIVDGSANSLTLNSGSLDSFSAGFEVNSGSLSLNHVNELNNDGSLTDQCTLSSVTDADGNICEARGENDMKDTGQQDNTVLECSLESDRQSNSEHYTTNGAADGSC